MQTFQAIAVSATVRIWPTKIVPATSNFSIPVYWFRCLWATYHRWKQEVGLPYHGFSYSRSRAWILEDLTEQELLFAYRRFLACHTLTLYFLSYNAPQFTLLNKLISQNFKHEFQWKFLPACSLWQGGVYKHTVKLVKDLLYRSFQGSVLSNSALHTALAPIH